MISIPKTELRRQYDAVIIGAGVGGLVCAGFLVRAGLSVLVLDQHYLPGGCCTAFPRKGKRYLFDAAVHHIGACGKFGTVGRIVKAFDLGIRFQRLDPMDHLVFSEDREYTIPSDWEAWKNQLCLSFPDQREGIERLFRDLQRFHRQMLKGSGPLLDQYRRTTYQSFLQDYVEDPELLRCLSGQWGYLGLPAERIAATGMVQMLVSYWREGAWYPQGSTQNFSNALAHSLLAAGGHLLLKHRVDEVLFEENGDTACHRAIGIRTEHGDVVRAKVVIHNGDARRLFEELLPQQAAPREHQACQKLQAATPYFGLYMALDAGCDLSRLPRGFYFPSRSEISDLEGGASLDWMYLSIGTRYDPDIAPQGDQIFSSTVAVRPDSPSFDAWQQDKSGMVKAVIAYLENRVPELQQHLQFVDSATPKTVARFTMSKDGAAYGWAVSPDQAAEDRLGPETSLAGLYLTGHWTSPGPGVAAVAASGWSVAHRILQNQNS
ncbi:MAG: NAD(P)/FAD-dependent oxidoreductase [Planctomycetota bacterium]|nr:MAG: NAD(P)/FAD-dependent oxidoreductase [Planctomycetota bacterium]